MPLPVDYGTGIVTGTFTDTNGDPVVGTISFTPSASRLLGTGAVILGDPITVPLDEDGSLSVTLPASDDPNVNPTDFTYRVDETFIGTVGSTYFIDVLEGTTLDLSDVYVPGTVNNGTVIWSGGGATVVDIFTDEADVISTGYFDGTPTGTTLGAAQQTDSADDGLYLSDGTTFNRTGDLPAQGPICSVFGYFGGTDHAGGFTWANFDGDWQVVGAGASTGGSGDVVGPASSTADTLALWDGITGKLLKDGLAVGTTAGTVAAGDDSRFTNSRAPTAHAASHKAGGSDPLATRLTFSDADYTIVTTTPSTVVSQTGTLSAPRTVTLPAASTVPAGAEVIISVGVGATGVNTLSIARAGSDTINGSTSPLVSPTPYAWRRLVSDGTSAWTLDAGILRQSDLGVTVAALASPTFTGTPAAPTATAGTNTTQVATTAFVTSASVRTLPTITGLYYSLGGGESNSTTGSLTASGQLRLHPVWLEAGTYDRLGIGVATQAVSTWRLGVYPTNATTLLPDGETLLLDAGTVDPNSATGYVSATVTLTISTTGLYWFAVLCDSYTATPSVAGWHGSPGATPNLPWRGNSVYGTINSRGTWARTKTGVTTGAIPATCPTMNPGDSCPQIMARKA